MCNAQDAGRIYPVPWKPREEFAICNSCSQKKKGKRPLRSNEDDETRPENALNENSELEEEINNDEDDVIYELAELEEIFARYFTEVNFSKTFELEDELIDNFNADCDTTEEDKFCNIIYFFLLPIEAGSRYYWEIRKFYCHQNNTGQATVYLDCTQRMNRKPTRPKNRPTKRISEARPPIERYS
ncbi:9473_t:CDS:1, partial [Paraglomus occultum]